MRLESVFESRKAHRKDQPATPQSVYTKNDCVFDGRDDTGFGSVFPTFTSRIRPGQKIRLSYHLRLLHLTIDVCNQGLNPIVVDEHTANVYWLYSNAIGGVKVQIPASEFTEFKSKLNLQTDYCFPSTVNDSNENLTSCPRCNSIEFHVDKWPKRLIFLTWLVIGFPVPIYSTATNCDDCGFEEHPKFDIPKQFKTIHLLALTTLVAIVLGVSINMGFDWIKLFAGRTVTR